MSSTYMQGRIITHASAKNSQQKHHKLSLMQSNARSDNNKPQVIYNLISSEAFSRAYIIRSWLSAALEKSLVF